MLVCRPWSLFNYILRHEQLWKGSLRGTLYCVLFFPVYPFFICFLRAVNTFSVATGITKKPASFDDGNVFFIPPNGVVSAFLWDSYKDLYVMVGMFLVIGFEPTGLRHTVSDIIPNKEFWRSLLRDSGAIVPGRIATWNAGQMVWDEVYTGQDIFVKLPDLYLGIGDATLEGGKEGFSSTAEEIEQYMQKHYPNKHGVLLLDWVRPSSHLEVHTFDVVTVKIPSIDDSKASSETGKISSDVQAISVLYWGNCTDGKSSHSCESGYVCNPDTEKIVGKASWYAPHFASMKADPTMMNHEPFEGVRESVALAIEAHKKILETQPWLVTIGWDFELTDRGPVFFEGNWASHRLPRRFFLSWTHLFKAIRLFYTDRKGGYLYE
eukprot:g2074.t1